MGLRSFILVLGAAMFIGCGQSKSPPPPGPAPAFQPPASTAEQTDQKTEESSPPANGQDVAEEMPAEEKEKMAIDAPAEERSESPSADDKPEEPAKDDAASDADATNEAAPTESGKPKGTGKLFRGLGSSLTRALAKLPSADTPAVEQREPPALKDDPFPDGEPSDNKANE